MKVEDISSLFFVLAVLVPGFIYRSVLARFIPTRDATSRENVVLGLLTATAFNYAVCFPLLYLLYVRQAFASGPFVQALLFVIIIFMVPIVLAIATAKLIQKDAFAWLCKWLGLRAIRSVTTGWEWIFSRIDSCYLQVTLRNGMQIAGYFGRRSVASSDPSRRDLYLEQTYTVPQDGEWKAVERSDGIYIDGAEILYVDFKARGFPDDSSRRLESERYDPPHGRLSANAEYR